MIHSRKVPPWLWAPWLCLVVAFCVGGCSNSTPGVTCSEPRQSKLWLLSEVGSNFEHHPDGSFQFPFHNGLDHPVQLRVRSIGCSCYQVRIGMNRLRVGDPIEIGAGQSETLGLYVSPPTGDQSKEYVFSVEYETKAGEPKAVIDCRGTMNCQADMRVYPDVLTAEFGKDSTIETLPFEVTRTAREEEVVNEPFEMQGWPEGASAAAPTPIGEAVKLHNGFWQRHWRTAVKLNPPEAGKEYPEFSRIRLLGGPKSSPVLRSVATPWSIVQLMVKLRNGLSGPRFIHFGEVKAGEPVTRRIQIVARDDRPFRVIGPLDPQLPLFVQSDQDAPGTTNWATLTLNPTQVGTYQETLNIQTDHPEHSQLHVDVRADVVSAANPANP